MTRTQLAALMALVVAVAATTAASFFTSSIRPCFIAGNAGYEISANGPADVTVRIDNAATKPNLRMQLTDDAAAADFVLVDDGDAASDCTGAAAIHSVRLDPAAADADLTVALSRAPADYKIYVRSTRFSQQDAAALFAVIWQNAGKTAGSGREFAARN